ncbi:DUF3515 family protein [Yinghuangia seranimata]|uniref:DUF3515 family protein n=1 Tax=Yinghuangia seranimata TaxID=408067 RepID=UPI00248ADEBC|nr:DUF3515 family protein [Yinghuangia seranimata]MDI2129312.1 DUF3515 family protein [Yinghuangia seranimata]
MTATTPAPAPPAPGPSGTTSRRRRALVRYGLPGAALAAAGLLTAYLVGRGGDDTVHIAVPQPPPGRIGEVCHELYAKLPADVLGGKRRDSAPVSELTAAWGSPAVVLRCGVPKPVSLRPSDPRYDPSQNSVGVNGVRWVFTTEGPGKALQFTTLNREVNVEVVVPPAYGQAPGVLTAFAEPIKATVVNLMPGDDAPAPEAGEPVEGPTASPGSG